MFEKFEVTIITLSIVVGSILFLGLLFGFGFLFAYLFDLDQDVGVAISAVSFLIGVPLWLDLTKETGDSPWLT